MITKVLLADDHEIVLDGLKSLIERLDYRTEIVSAKNGRDAIKLAQEFEPDISILDITMPDLNGLEAAQQIKTILPKCAIIILSMHNDKGYVAKALQAGALGYLLKNSAFQELEEAIQSVRSGRIFLSSDINDLVVEDYVDRLTLTKNTSPLTTREREIVQLVAEGKSSKQIADRLNISVKTVEVHRRNIMTKMEFHSTADLTRYAIREGLTSADL